MDLPKFIGLVIRRTKTNVHWAKEMHAFGGW